MPVSVNLYLTSVEAIEMNLRKSYLNRRKLRGKSQQKLLLLLQKQRIRRRNKLQSCQFIFCYKTTCSLGVSL